MDWLWTKQCTRLCVCRALWLSWGTLIRSTLTANRDGELQPQTTGTEELTGDEEKRKCSFIHSFPNSVYVFVLTAVSVFSRVWVCVCRMNTAQWLRCEVTDSFIMASAQRETAPSRGRREEDRDRGTETGDRPGLLLDRPVSVQQLVEGGGDSCCLL